MANNEYRVITADSASKLRALLAQEAGQGWKPILLSTACPATSMGPGLIITVILEHVPGRVG